MPFFKSDGSSINALQSEVEQRQSGGSRLLLAFGKGVSFFYLEQKKKKPKLLPLSCAGSLTHTYALSVTIFYYKCLTVAIFVN